MPPPLRAVRPDEPPPDNDSGGNSHALIATCTIVFSLIATGCLLFVLNEQGLIQFPSRTATERVADPPPIAEEGYLIFAPYMRFDQAAIDLGVELGELKQELAWNKHNWNGIARVIDKFARWKWFMREHVKTLKNLSPESAKVDVPKITTQVEYFEQDIISAARRIDDGRDSEATQLLNSRFTEYEQKLTSDDYHDYLKQRLPSEAIHEKYRTDYMREIGK